MDGCGGMDVEAGLHRPGRISGELGGCAASPRRAPAGLLTGGEPPARQRASSAGGGAGMGLDVHGGVFLVAGRVFSLLLVSPLLWPDPVLVVGNARGRAEALACHRNLRRIDGDRG
uniref:Uncharacterized protein n=1 Tax=Oryza punctata TaxID=4537 RepID=A0A0E0MMV5_ORYPU